MIEYDDRHWPEDMTGLPAVDMQTRCMRLGLPWGRGSYNESPSGDLAPYDGTQEEADQTIHLYMGLLLRDMLPD